MPSTVRTVSRLWLALAASLVIIGSLIIAVVAIAQSSSVAACVNRVQAERAEATQIVYNAQIRKTQAENRKTTAELDWVRGRLSDAKYAAEVDRFEAEVDRFSKAQQQSQQYRAQHPAGRC